MMIAHVFRRRAETNVALASKVEMEADDPRQIAPTIAKIAPVPTIELKGKIQSRIKNKMVNNCFVNYMYFTLLSLNCRTQHSDLTGYNRKTL